MAVLPFGIVEEGLARGSKIFLVQVSWQFLHSCASFWHETEHILFDVLVQETGTSFLYVCHRHKTNRIYRR